VFVEQVKLFEPILEKLLLLMLEADEAFRLYPFKESDRDMRVQELFNLDNTAQDEFIKITEGPYWSYIDAYIHVRSKNTSLKLKRFTLPFLKENNMILDEYKLNSLEEVQVWWLFGKSSFAIADDSTKSWLDALLGPENSQTLDYQIRSQGIKYSKFGIEIKTFAFVISSSKSTSQATYHAMAKLWPIRSDYTVGFVGYQALNFAASQDQEGIAQYCIQQKWLTASLRTKQMTGGFSNIDTS